MVGTGYDWALLLGGLLLALYVYGTWTFDFWKKKGVKYIKGVPLLGTSWQSVLALKPSCAVQQDYYWQLKEHRFGGVFLMRSPALFVTDPAIIERVLVKDFTNFYNRGLKVDEELDPLTGHLVNLENERWRALRTKLTPVFSSGKLRTMHKLLVDCGYLLLRYLEEMEKGPLEARDVMAQFTTDVIGTCAFGIQMNAIQDPNSEFRQLGKDFFAPTFLSRLRFSIRMGFPAILSLLRWKAVSNSSHKFFVTALKDTIKVRQETGEQRNDFLQLLINLREQELKENKKVLILDEKTMLANAFVFFLAGFETTASTLSYCLFELSRNPEIQDKLHGEVKRVLDSHQGDVNYDILKEIGYLDQVINETLRMYPPVVGLIRECTKEWEVPDSPGVKLRVGDLVQIPTYALQHDPEYYPQPEVFRPERFAPPNTPPKGTFLPFGDGPRVCIGERFARTEIKVALSLLLMKYKVVLSDKTRLPLQYEEKSGFLIPKGGLWLNIVRRS